MVVVINEMTFTASRTPYVPLAHWSYLSGISSSTSMQSLETHAATDQAAQSYAMTAKAGLDIYILYRWVSRSCGNSILCARLDDDGNRLCSGRAIQGNSVGPRTDAEVWREDK